MISYILLELTELLGLEPVSLVMKKCWIS